MLEAYVCCYREKAGREDISCAVTKKNGNRTEMMFPEFGLGEGSGERSNKQVIIICERTIYMADT